MGLEPATSRTVVRRSTNKTPYCVLFDLSQVSCWWRLNLGKTILNTFRSLFRRHSFVISRARLLGENREKMSYISDVGKRLFVLQSWKFSGEGRRAKEIPFLPSSSPPPLFLLTPGALLRSPAGLFHLIAWKMNGNGCYVGQFTRHQNVWSTSYWKVLCGCFKYLV